MLARGYTQTQIARILKITYTAMRQRISRLKISIGATTMEQMMIEYGKYIQKQT